MQQLTKNIIILFNNSKLKYEFQKSFLKIEDEDDETICYYVGGDISDDYKINIRRYVEYRPTSIYIVDNKQRIILTTEASFILQCINPYDLWFCETKNNEIQLYPFTDL